VLISALTESGAALVTRQIAAAMPTAQIFGTAGIAESTFTDPAAGGIPLSLDDRILLTCATVVPGSGPSGTRAFYTAYDRSYGAAQPDAIYGYEAMSLILSAISRASDGGRQTVRRSEVLAALFHTRRRQSVLGTYSLRPDGDTTIRRYGIYRIVDGEMSYWTSLDG
jgi:branched-chain amino acid transport system substrate-binding protein